MKAMEQNNDLQYGHISLLVSLLTGFFAWLGSLNAGEVLKGLSLIVSIGAGIMAIRYYYYATKKAKK